MHIDASSFSTYSYLRRRFGEVNAKILVNLTIVTDRNGLKIEEKKLIVLENFEIIKDCWYSCEEGIRCTVRGERYTVRD